MCFSATANLVAGGLVSVVGVATLYEVERPREYVLGALPLAFGVHQLLEAVVWLDLTGRIGGALGDVAAAAYLGYAQALLPLLGPLAVLLVLPPGWRRRAVGALLAVGVALAAYIGWTLVAMDWSVTIEGNTLDYANEGIRSAVVGVLYVVTTVGPFLVSGQRFLVAFGALNLVGLLAVFAAKAYALTSVWCFYAAVVSVVLYGWFRRRRRDRVPAAA